MKRKLFAIVLVAVVLALAAVATTVALDKSWRRENLRAVVFLQEHASRRVVGAVSLKLFG